MNQTYPCVKIVGEKTDLDLAIDHALLSGAVRLNDTSVVLSGDCLQAEIISKALPLFAVSSEEADDEDVAETIYVGGHTVSGVIRRDWGTPAAYPPTEWMLRMLRSHTTTWE
jgi:hypothetical protein